MRPYGAGFAKERQCAAILSRLSDEAMEYVVHCFTNNADPEAFFSQLRGEFILSTFQISAMRKFQRRDYREGELTVDYTKDIRQLCSRAFPTEPMRTRNVDGDIQINQ